MNTEREDGWVCVRVRVFFLHDATTKPKWPLNSERCSPFTRARVPCDRYLAFNANIISIQFNSARSYASFRALPSYLCEDDDDDDPRGSALGENFLEHFQAIARSRA
jgi:hypothetical protein